MIFFPECSSLAAFYVMFASVTESDMLKHWIKMTCFLWNIKARTSRVLVLKLFECIIQLMLSKIEMQRDIITCNRVIIGYSEYSGGPNRRWKLGLSDRDWVPLIRSPWWPRASHLSPTKFQNIGFTFQCGVKDLQGFYCKVLSSLFSWGQIHFILTVKWWKV